MLLTSISTFVALRKLTIVETSDDAEDIDQRPANTDSISSEATAYSPEHYALLKQIGKLLFIRISFFSCFGIFLHICSRYKTKIFSHFSDTLCNANTPICCDVTTIRAKCNLFHRLFANRNHLVNVQRHRSGLCHCLSYIMCYARRTYQRIACIPNTLATRIFRCQ